jgi:hypothetical protein
MRRSIAKQPAGALSAPLARHPDVRAKDGLCPSFALYLSSQAAKPLGYETAVSPGRGSRTPVSGGPTGSGSGGRR